jgi:AcrR family transcriptional regulator
MTQSARKTEILCQAAKLFRERGFGGVSMRDIAQALDIKAASLYNHITSKQEILVSIVIQIAEEFTSGMESIAKSDSTSIQKLEKLIELHIDITLRDPNEMACLNNDWMHLEESNRAYFLKMRDEYEANFRQIVQTGITNHELADIDIEVISFTTLSTLRTLYLWLGKKTGRNFPQLRKDMARVLLRGIV